MNKVLLVALFSISVLASAAELSSRVLFQTSALVPTSKGKERRVNISVRRWNLDKGDEALQVILISEFSVMSLRSGRVETTINGKTEERSPEDFWAVRSGDKLQIRVLGENAILEAVEVKR